eukprot:CAMPEP_0194301762 /NCGR_PEP_ID=MMETSP0169-20130528/61970_1 /TAXON_ID=218684 /ORGANISM="Corethron pennatum, Strain L29A3" /LENGTH=488 /DNA_ID=CAMNT_0039052035 /DNA_START=10 /DNA_END=1473 /DNA_ORIENTATION=-
MNRPPDDMSHPTVPASDDSVTTPISPPEKIHPIRLIGRAVRRRRFGPSLHFVTLVHDTLDGANSLSSTEIVLRADALSVPSVAPLYSLGDVLLISGAPDPRGGRAGAVLVSSLYPVERWSDAFGDAPPSFPRGGSPLPVVAAYLQCDRSHAVRVADRLAEMGTATAPVIHPPGATRRSGCLLPVADWGPADGEKAAHAWMREDEGRKHVQRVFDARRPCWTVREAAAAVDAGLADDGKIRAFPAVLGARLAASLPGRGGGGTWAEAAVAFDGMRLFVACGTSDRGTDGTGTPAGDNKVVPARERHGVVPVSRAYHKLAEAARRLPLPVAGTAMDVGASPGGWTQCLLAAGADVHVVAVDPGQLDTRVAAEAGVGRLRHLRIKAEEAALILTEEGATIGCYASDMNVCPNVAVDVFLKVLPLVKAGAPVFITLKNTFRGTADWDVAVAEARLRLEGSDAGLVETEVVQLFANTKRECTFLGRVPSGDKR